MAGLLGQGWEDPKSSAIMALAGGLLQGNFGQGLLGANQAYAQHGENQLKKKLTDAQLRNYESEIEARRLKVLQDQRQQEFDQQFFGMSPGGQPSAPGAPSVPGAPAMPSANVAGGPPAAGAPVGGGFTAQQISQQYGIPLEAVIADYKFNGGKKIAELIDSRAKPNWMNVNGNIVNTNQPNFQGGLQAGINAGRDGQVTAWQPDGRGGIVVGAPQGAFETYGRYKSIEEGAKAGHDLVQVYDENTKSMVFRPRSQVLGAAQPTPPAAPMRPSTSEAGLRTQVQGGMGADPAAIQREIQKTRASMPFVKDPASRQALETYVADLEQQAARIPRGPMSAGPSVTDATTAAADREQAIQAARDMAEQRKGIMQAGFAASSNIAKYEQIGKLLENVDGGSLTATGTQLASTMNSLGFKIDKNLPNKEAAAALANEAALQLRNPSGGAGMPGALSDKDRDFLTGMTPNAAQSAEGRKLIIRSYVALQRRNQQVAQFARNYEKKYGKLDNGFFDQLQAWSNANPMFGTK